MSRSQQPVAQAASGLPAHQSNKRPLEAAADPEVIRAPYHIIDSGARTATGVALPEAASKAAKHTASSTPLSMSQPVDQAGAAGALSLPLFPPFLSTLMRSMNLQALFSSAACAHLLQYVCRGHHFCRNLSASAEKVLTKCNCTHM